MKKSQIKMMETIMVLFVLFIILAVGMVFYYNIQQSSIIQKSEEKKEIKAVEVSQFVSSLIELQCAQEDIRDFNCFDWLRLLSFKEKIEQNSRLRNNYYYDLLGDSAVTVKTIFPDQAYWVLYNRSDETKSKYRFFTPISVFNASDETFSFGILTVDYYG